MPGRTDCREGTRGLWGQPEKVERRFMSTTKRQIRDVLKAAVQMHRSGQLEAAARLYERSGMTKTTPMPCTGWAFSITRRVTTPWPWS